MGLSETYSPSCDLVAALRGMQGAVRQNVVLAPLAHLRVGGPADWFVEPFHAEDVAHAVRVFRDNGIPWRVLGGGSNVLIADEGVRGAVLSLGNLNRITRDGTSVRVEAGTTMASLLRTTREQGLAGLETLTGIPAHLGGAVAMNAGTRDGETFDRLTSVTLVDPEGNLVERSRSECSPVYRDGGLAGHVVLQAAFALEKDDPRAIFDRFSASLKKRNATQPVTRHSVGCVFRNPKGDAAGRLIEASGCKNLSVGDIHVSDVHANYFVNLGVGTCAQFRQLMAEVRRRVFEHAGIQLEPEVKFWGFS